MIWTVCYAFFADVRSQIIAAGLILGVVLYIAALPASLLVTHDSIKAENTIDGLLVLLVLVFVNFGLFASIEAVRHRIKEKSND